MFANILAPIDFQDDASVILGHAAQLALKFNSRVWVVHIATPDPEFVGYSVGPQYIRDFRAEELKNEHQQIKALCEKLIDQGVDAEGLLIAGATVDMITKECQKLKIDLICMGHRKQGWLEHLFKIHTDFSIIDQVKVPVLTIQLE